MIISCNTNVGYNIGIRYLNEPVHGMFILKGYPLNMRTQSS